MPYHVDTTANLERTSEELLRITYSLSEVDSVVDGYPELDSRLYAGLHAITDPENQHLLGMREDQYRHVLSVANDLQSAYPMLDRD